MSLPKLLAELQVDGNERLRLAIRAALVDLPHDWLPSRKARAALRQGKLQELLDELASTELRAARRRGDIDDIGRDPMASAALVAAGLHWALKGGLRIPSEYAAEMAHDLRELTDRARRAAAHDKASAGGKAAAGRSSHRPIDILISKELARVADSPVRVPTRQIAERVIKAARGQVSIEVKLDTVRRKIDRARNG